MSDPVRVPRLSLLRGLRRKIFSISLDEASFSRRGFNCRDATTQTRLETIGETFIHGYNRAVMVRSSDELVDDLHAVALPLQGFAFEGAAMGLSLLDRLDPRRRRRRIVDFIAGPGNAHIYMVHVGIGWMLARLRWGIAGALAQLDPLLRWLAVDGYGFHEGYFHSRKYLSSHAAHRGPSAYWPRAFDQGFGRSLWFSRGGDVEAIGRVIESFAAERRADLWSGIGLASTYAGGADHHSLRKMKGRAGRHVAHVAQGSAFATKARHRAGNATAESCDACEVLCEMPAEHAATLVDESLRSLTSDPSVPDYEVWRRRVRLHFSNHLRGTT